jgi:hypothetical protein
MKTLQLRLFVVAVSVLVALMIFSRQFPNSSVGIIKGGWLLMGVYVTLLGFRLVGPVPGVNVRYEDMYENRIKWGKIIGPLIIAKGLAFFVFGFRVPHDLIR